MADAATAELSSAPATEVEKSRAQPAGAAATRASAGAPGAPAPTVSPDAAHRLQVGEPEASSAAPEADDAAVEAAAEREVDEENDEQAAEEAESEAEETEAPGSAQSTGVSAKRGLGVKRTVARFISKTTGLPVEVPDHDSSDYSENKELKKIKASVAQALSMARKGLGKISKDNSLYQKFIDNGAGEAKTDPAKSEAQARIDKVKKGFEEIIACLENDRVTFKKWEVTEPDEDSTFAYVRKGEAENNIYLGGAFWVAANKGIDSSGGTIVHELSHRLADTVDHKYGMDGVLELAKDRPDEGAENADSWEYLAESA
jgi:hypothetical protein